jgi:hypothetical protein
MASDIDILRVPEKKSEHQSFDRTELENLTYRSWWCKKFHDLDMVTVGHTYVGRSFQPIRVCGKCLLDHMF